MTRPPNRTEALGDLAPKLDSLLGRAVGCPEWKVSSHEIEHEHAERIPVDSVVEVSAELGDLWWGIFDGSMPELRNVVHGHRTGKVAQLDMSGTVYENVLWLQVAVDDAERVDVPQALGYFTDVEPRLARRKDPLTKSVRGAQD